MLRLHLLGLANAPVSEDFSLDGFAAATHRFARMMMSLGHTVYLYGAEGSNAPCTEFINVMPDADRRRYIGKSEYQHMPVDRKHPLYVQQNAWAIKEIAKRKQPRDFLLTIGGHSHQPVFEAHKDLLHCEYSVGYEGVFSAFRVFESYAWMHYIYGATNTKVGRFFDEVIPLFFDSEHFFERTPEDYFLYVGRLTHEKGLGVACEAATKAGVKLKIVGHGGSQQNITGGHEFLGAVDWRVRNELLARAKAVLCPSLYIEPFNAVAVEAQLCGTPVISTDWGGFTETVEQGVSGYRCRMLRDFIGAIHQVDGLNRSLIRARAVEKYSMHNIKWSYDRYLNRLATLWEKGWNAP